MIVGAAYGETEEASYIESDLYIEAPLAARVSVVSNHWVQTVSTFEGVDTRVQSDVNLKYRLLRSDHGVVAIQGGAVWDSRAAGECGEYGGDVRLLGGLSSHNGRFFANLEGGARVQGADCIHAKYDLALGWKPVRRFMALAEVFVDDDLTYGESFKAQASLVGFSREGRGLQLGVRVGVDGNDVIEPLILLRYWSAPRR